MFSIPEYARVLFGSLWIKDSNEPQSAVTDARAIRPIASHIMPSVMPMHPKIVLNITSIATFEHTVESSAAVWVGAVL